MQKVIGIDLGTTYSSVAFVNQHGQPEMIPNREGERITPSVVLFDGDAPIVGSMAKRSAVAAPLNVCQFVKRQMGDPAWKFRTETGVVFTPEEISSLILKRLKEDAETIIGANVTDAVITVPAYFNDPQRKATLDAGEIAGLSVLKIINEPTAAALAYGLQKLENDETVLVYDLGGGTFDVTIMRVSGNSIDVLATGGDKNLGGFDWDNEMMTLLAERVKEQGGPDLFDDPGLSQDLRDKAEIAKKTLSTRDKTSVFLSGGGKNYSIPVTLAEFEERTASLLQRTSKIMQFVLEDSGKDWDDIQKVLLVGGSTRMTAVPSLVESITGKAPSREVHPDEVVSIGAALQAELLSKDIQDDDSQGMLVEINDVTAHSMGVIAWNTEKDKDYNSIVLKKDTTVPCQVSSVYETVSDNQTQLHVRITQGEDEDPEFVKILDETILEIPSYPKGAPVEVFFKYDANQTVWVEVIDLTTNKSLGEREIRGKANLDENRIQELKKKIRTVNVG
ncbi:MAG: Hsp70 family protein [Candidatus Thiodiazotropha sp. (ex Ctena orbiculata)]|nr:Hsp70 family protein [Candidatus Thiodiazotropha taylori]